MRTIVLLVTLFIQSTISVDLTIDLPYGTIEGREAVTPSNRSFRAFQGVPYAAAPIGPLRFQPPAPPQNWTGIKPTTKDSNICYSVTKDSNDENEDCLYINVYTPILTNNETSKLPVMLWIYGGAYRTGSDKYNNFGPDYLIEKDVIVATFNYRLGPFGFLATEDGVVYGNAGLKDQAAAIKWVHDHISLFGGDPEKVTIFGQSAGGSSVGYHLLYKKNEGLIKGAILQSGSPLSQFSYMGDVSARDYAFDLASQIDNSVNFQNDSRILLDFLLNVTAKEIDIASTLTTVTDRALPVIEPEHDGAFITKASFELLSRGEFLKIPILLGIASEEAISTTDLNELNSSYTKAEAEHSKLIPSKGFHVKDGVDEGTVGDALFNLYFANVSSENLVGQYLKYKSDNQYNKPVIRHAEFAAAAGLDVYFYILSHDGPMGNFDDTVQGADKVGHSEDTKYIFKVVSSSYTNADLSIFPESDVLTHYRMVEMWTNFAKYLNPTPVESDLLQNITWPKVTTSNFQYLDIGDDLTIKSNPKSPYHETWKKIYDDYNQRPFTVF